MRVHRNCCGLDVHKKIIAACLIREDAEGDGHRRSPKLHRLSQCLRLDNAAPKVVSTACPHLLAQTKLSRKIRCFGRVLC